MKRMWLILGFVFVLLNLVLVVASPLTYLNYTVSDSELEVGYTGLLGASDQFLFSIEGEECRLMATTINLNSIKFTDCKNTVDLGIDNDFYEDNVKLDVSLDDYYDYSVKLNEINNSKASLTIKKINEEIPKGAKTYYFCAKFYKCPDGEKVVYTEMRGNGCGLTNNPFSLCSEASIRDSCRKYYDCSSGSRITECKIVGNSGDSNYGCECINNPESLCEGQDDEYDNYSEPNQNKTGLMKCPLIDTPQICPEGSLSVLVKDSDDCITKYKCNKKLSNGRSVEIKIMPETASQKAIDKLGELNFTIELKEVGKGDDSKVVYELTGKKNGKFLGIFKIIAKVSVQVDSETGKVIKVIRPWWGFLAGI